MLCDNVLFNNISVISRILSSRRDAAAKALAEAYGAQKPAIALMLDIDRFKRVNDQYGHDFGDAVLRGIGEVLNSFSRERNLLVGRHGGEEFVALLVGVSPENALATAEQLRQACAAKDIVSDGTLTTVTVSIGVAVAKGSEGLSKALKLADEALYRSKRGGRDRVSVYDDRDNIVALGDRAFAQ